MTSPTIPEQSHRSNPTLRSCLLRTETLPVGIITSTQFNNPPKTEETNNQFILRPKEPPNSQAITLDTLEQDADDARRRLASVSSQKSQLTDDDDDKSSTLHALSDEQLDHLAYEYNPYQSEISYSTGTLSRTSSLLSDSLLY